jgi:hypothetical protein
MKSMSLHLIRLIKSVRDSVFTLTYANESKPKGHSKSHQDTDEGDALPRWIFLGFEDSASHLYRELSISIENFEWKTANEVNGN